MLANFLKILPNCLREMRFILRIHRILQDEFMPYAITALADGMVLSQTRVQHASAILLARKWITSGFKDVEIIDGCKRYTPEAFRKRFVWANGGYEDHENLDRVTGGA